MLKPFKKPDQAMLKTTIKGMKLILVWMFCCLSLINYAQSSDQKIAEILAKTKESYEKWDSYTLQSTYTLFQGQNSNRVDDSYEGFLVKNKEHYYSRIHNTEFVYSNTKMLKINHDQKRIQYSIVDVKNTNPTQQMDIATYLVYYKDKKLEETEDQFICTLTTTAITPLPYGKVAFYIDKDSHQINKQVLYYLTKGAFKDQNGKEFYAVPRLEITFSELKSEISSHLDKLMLTNYVFMKKDGIRGKEKLASYEIITL